MKNFLWLWLAVSLPALADTPPWQFTDASTVVTQAPSQTFYHLESAGRKNIAANAERAVVIWEDNRSGQPQIYVAPKMHGQTEFAATIAVSVGKAAYEPVIATLSADRFLFAWEQDGEIWVRSMNGSALGPPKRLAGAASQVSLAASGERIVAVWAQTLDGQPKIMAASLRVDAEGVVHSAPSRAVDRTAGKAEQAYPSVALSGASTVVAWEDRRHGHTVIYSAFAAADLAFGAARRLNEQPPTRSAVFGRGSGVARVALASLGEKKIAAVWLDKRDFTGGYDTYLAISENGGRQFGANQKVQDDFGEGISQWHAALAADVAGRLAVVWHDERDGSGDLWLSWPIQAGFSADLAVPGPAGPRRHRSHPSIALDPQGDLHLAWIERQTETHAQSLRYTHARRAERPGR